MTIGAVIAVPMRNEAAHLPRLLDALTRQTTASGFHVHLFFDGCTDGGPGMGAALADRMPFPVAISAAGDAGPANAGLARRYACAAALADAPDACLLTTDADSEPADDWVATSLAALAFADIVAGRIETARGSSTLQQSLSDYLDRLYCHRRTVDPVAWEDDRIHHWTSAASLGFAPGVYRALGGFAPLASGEDADLCDRAWRAGFRVRRDARVRVSTSARRGGRVAGGFAGLLAALDLDGAAPMVAHPADEAWRYSHHAWARHVWAQGATEAFACAVGADMSNVERVAAASSNAEAFTAQIVGAPPGGMRSVALREAAAILGSWTGVAAAEVT